MKRNTTLLAAVIVSMILSIGAMYWMLKESGIIEQTHSVESEEEK